MKRKNTHKVALLHRLASGTIGIGIIFITSQQIEHTLFTQFYVVFRSKMLQFTRPAETEIGSLSDISDPAGWGSSHKL